MSTLQEKIKQDRNLKFDGLLLFHRLSRQKGEPEISDRNKTLKQIVFVASQLSEINYPITSIEIPALSRIIGEHIYDGSISKVKARNIAIFFHQILKYIKIFKNNFP